MKRQRCVVWTVVSVLLTLCVFEVDARPAVDNSPDRVKYQVQAYGYVKIPGEAVWVPGSS